MGGVWILNLTTKKSLGGRVWVLGFVGRVPFGVLSGFRVHSIV